MKNEPLITSLIDLMNVFPNDKACREYFEQIRWNGGEPVCPHCKKTEKIYRFKDGRLFKCGSCDKQFSVTVGTVFEGSHIALKKWFWAIFLFSSHKKGISSIQLGKDIKVQQKTAWFMLQRIRFMMSNKTFWKQLSGEVQCDETLIGGKEKNKHKDKKIKGAQGRNTAGKSIVFGMKEKDGDVRAMKIDDASSQNIHPVIVENITFGSKLITDEWKGYNGLTKIYEHERVNHSQGEYVRDNITTNNIENFWSLLKRGIYGIYHHTSSKHLSKYADEFTYRYNSRSINEADRFSMTLGKCEGRLTYKNLIQKNA